MAEVLVTGGTGHLGRALVPRLVDSGHRVRVLSRRADPELPAGVTAVRGDLVKGDGIAEAVDGAQVVVHCAGGTSGASTMFYRAAKKTDADATKTLLDAASAADVEHIVYISIVGIDRVPLGYYRAKLDAEGHITSSSVPWSTLRTTQWHTLAAEFCRRLTRGPLVVVPKGFALQLLDPGEVADRMASIVQAGPSQRTPDMGGPRVIPLEEIAATYLAAHGKEKRVRALRMPGKTAAAFRAGHNTTPEHADGTITWERWLAQNVTAA